MSSVASVIAAASGRAPDIQWSRIYSIPWRDHGTGRVCLLVGSQWHAYKSSDPRKISFRPEGAELCDGYPVCGSTGFDHSNLCKTCEGAMILRSERNSIVARTNSQGSESTYDTGGAAASYLIKYVTGHHACPRSKIKISNHSSLLYDIYIYVYISAVLLLSSSSSELLPHGKS